VIYERRKSTLEKKVCTESAKACPFGVDQKQWDKLMIYWQQCDTKTKNEHMVDARGAVANVSHLGCGGKVVVEVKLVS
jgi:hypothetical protein